MKFEKPEDFYSLEMYAERLIRLEASESANLEELVRNLWQHESAHGAHSRAVVQRALAAHNYSLAEQLSLNPDLKTALYDIRHALFVFVQPTLLLLATLFELLTFAVLVHLKCTRGGSASATQAADVNLLYVVLHVGAVLIENTVFHGLEWFAYAFGVGRPATAQRLLCNFWWLGFKMVHVFPLWILVPAAFQIGRFLFLFILILKTIRKIMSRFFSTNCSLVVLELV